MTLKNGSGVDYEKGTILLEDIRNVIEKGMPELKERQRIVGKIQNISQLMYDDRHRTGPLYDFVDGKSTKLVEETLIWWETRIKKALSGQPIPHIGRKSSGDIINSWTDAAGPKYKHI